MYMGIELTSAICQFLHSISDMMDISGLMEAIVRDRNASCSRKMQLWLTTWLVI